MSESLSGQVAVVTGASGGIGHATALALAAEGVSVAVGARNEAALQDLVKSITEKGGKAVSVRTDITEKGQVKALVAMAESTFGPVDILVNSAGIWYLTLMKNLKVDAWEKMIDVNCKGTLNCIAAVLDSMVTRKKGHIVTITSDSARMPFAGFAVYGGTKYFLEGMIGSMRREVAQYGIRMTTILPGDVDTPGTHKEAFDEEAEELYNRGSMADVLQADDIARAVVYALSQPSYVAVNEVLIQPKDRPC